MSIIGDLFELSGNARRDLARNLFPGFYERNLTASQALNELKELGISYRRQDFLSDFNQGKGSYTQATRVRFVSPSNIPSDNILESKYFGTPDKYSFVYKYTGIDTDTGENKEGYFFYHRNSIDTRQNMEDDALDFLTNNSENYPVDVATVRIVEGYINPIWG